MEKDFLKIILGSCSQFLIQVNDGFSQASSLNFVTLCIFLVLIHNSVLVSGPLCVQHRLSFCTNYTQVYHTLQRTLFQVRTLDSCLAHVIP